MDVYPLQNAPAPYLLTPSIEQVAAAWLQSKSGRSGSEKTRRAYADTLASFRERLKGAGLDLDSAPRMVALAAAGWAADGEAAPATYNQRLAIVSSFYSYCQTSELRPDLVNPIARVEKRPVQSYRAARPLDRVQVARALGAIDRLEPAGARDYVLLRVGLTTFRRASELAGLRWGDIGRAGDLLIVTWTRCKGGTTMRDILPAAVSGELLAYLRQVYGADLSGLAPSAPVWVSFSKNTSAGQAISARAIADICLKHLGVSTVHSLRHTGARAMEDAGAKVSEIQARLGHASLATTGRYLKALASAENPYGDRLAAMFDPIVAD